MEHAQKHTLRKGTRPLIRGLVILKALCSKESLPKINKEQRKFVRPKCTNCTRYSSIRFYNSVDDIYIYIIYYHIQLEASLCFLCCSPVPQLFSSRKAAQKNWHAIAVLLTAGSQNSVGPTSRVKSPKSLHSPSDHVFERSWFLKICLQWR